MRKQTFDYHSFRRQSISEDLHEDEEVILDSEEVILDSELVTEIPVRLKIIYLFAVLFSLIDIIMTVRVKICSRNF